MLAKASSVLQTVLIVLPGSLCKVPPISPNCSATQQCLPRNLCNSKAGDQCEIEGYKWNFAEASQWNSECCSSGGGGEQGMSQILPYRPESGAPCSSQLE